jgi:hypothetical protein
MNPFHTLPPYFPKIIIIINFKLGHHGLFRFRMLTSELMYLFRQLVGLLGRGISPTQGLYLHRITQHRKTRTHISMPRARFEPMSPVFEQSKTIRALGRAAIGTGISLILILISSRLYLGLPSDLFPWGFPPKIMYEFPMSPCVLHAPPISSFLI